MSELASMRASPAIVVANRCLVVSALALAFGSACTGQIDAPTDDAVLRPDGCNDNALRGESQRLDARELQATLDSLLGFHVTLSPGFPEPLQNDGYSTYPESNRIAYDDVRRIADTADAAAIEARTHFGELLPCPVSSIDEACVRTFIGTFAERAFRGTYTAEDGERFLELYRRLRQEPDALEPDLAVAGVISAVLQSPGVLYLVERGRGSGARRTLTDREIANRMAYLFWDAPPDASLLAVDLSSTSARAREAERMLADPRAPGAVLRFFREWLGVDGQDQTDRVGASIAAAFDEELRRYIEASVFEPDAGGIAEFFGSDRTFVNRALAMHYGLSTVPANDSTWTEVTLPWATGILGRGSVATAHANDGATSIVKRGHFVRSVLLCDELGTPPAGAIAQNPVLPPMATVRERMNARDAVPGCNYCHRKMDAIGIGMEDIDFMGRIRTAYADTGHVVDSSGQIRALDGATEPFYFDGTAELAAALGASDQAAMCMSTQWFRFAMGRFRGASCNAPTMHERVLSSGHDMRALLIALVSTEGFVQRAEDE